MTTIIRIAYGFSGIEYLVFIYLTQQMVRGRNILPMAYNIFVNFILLLSALLYIPIVYSISKLSHLPSVQFSRPQRYVMWQLIAILIEKLVYIFWFLYYNDLKESSFISKMFDIFLIPLVVQITYLGCNKRNFETLFVTLRTKFRRSNNSVHYETSHGSSNPVV